MSDVETERACCRACWLALLAARAENRELHESNRIVHEENAQLDRDLREAIGAPPLELLP